MTCQEGEYSCTTPEVVIMFVWGGRRSSSGGRGHKLSLMICQGVNIFFSEFRKLKEENNADFFKMVQTPELACELTLQVNRPFTSLDYFEIWLLWYIHFIMSIYYATLEAIISKFEQWIIGSGIYCVSSSNHVLTVYVSYWVLICGNMVHVYQIISPWHWYFFAAHKKISFGCCYHFFRYPCHSSGGYMYSSLPLISTCTFSSLFSICFLFVLLERISSNIKTSHQCWSFHSFSLPVHVIWQWNCEEKFDTGHYWGLKGLINSMSPKLKMLQGLYVNRQLIWGQTPKLCITVYWN